MKGFSINWWRWLVLMLFSVVLAGMFIWRSEERDQGVIIGEQEAAAPVSSLAPRKRPKSLIGPKEAKTPEELSVEFNTQAMEGIRQKLTEDREFLQRLQKEPAEELLSRLQALWNSTLITSNTTEEKALVRMAFTQALHFGDETSNKPIYEQLSALLRGDTLPLTAKNEIASILGLVQTPSSVQILLEEYERAIDGKLRENLGNEITRAGDNLWAGRFREDLSPPLESAWPRAKNDPKLAQALASGLAKVGTAGGVQLLLNEVLRSTQTVDGLSGLRDPQGKAAFLALVKVRNPDAIPVFEKGLLNSDSSELQRFVSGRSLSTMGRVEATQILLQWAATAPDRETVWAEQWFGKLRDIASFDLVASTLDPANGVKFVSVTIRNAVVLGQSNRER